MPDSPTTIHAFPELRQLAEREARAAYDAFVRYAEEHPRHSDTGSRRAMTFVWDNNQGTREWWIAAHLALLCDLSRDASRDAVARVVAQRIAWPAWEVAKAEDNWTTLVALCRKVGIPEPARWEPHPPFAATLTTIVRHLWPENADAR